MKWWDDTELTLLAFTGDVGLAEEWAAYCQQASADLMAVTGLSEVVVNDGLAAFVAGRAVLGKDTDR